MSGVCKEEKGAAAPTSAVPAFVVYLDLVCCNLVYPASSCGDELCWLPLAPDTDVESVRLSDARSGKSVPFLLCERATEAPAPPVASAPCPKAERPSFPTRRSARSSTPTRKSEWPGPLWVRCAAAPGAVRLTYRSTTLSYAPHASAALRKSPPPPTGASRSLLTAREAEEEGALVEGECAEPAWRTQWLWTGELELLASLRLRAAREAAAAWAPFLAAPARLVDARWGASEAGGRALDRQLGDYGGYDGRRRRAAAQEQAGRVAAPARDWQWTLRALPSALWPPADAAPTACAPAMGPACGLTCSVPLGSWRLESAYVACVVRAHTGGGDEDGEPDAPTCGYETSFLLPRPLPANCPVEVTDARTGEPFARAAVDAANRAQLRVTFERATCVLFDAKGLEHTHAATAAREGAYRFRSSARFGPSVSTSSSSSPAAIAAAAAGAHTRYQLRMTNASARALKVRVVVDVPRRAAQRYRQRGTAEGDEDEDDAALALEWTPAPATAGAYANGAELVWEVDLPPLQPTLFHAHGTLAAAPTQAPGPEQEQGQGQRQRPRHTSGEAPIPYAMRAATVGPFDNAL